MARADSGGRPMARVMKSKKGGWWPPRPPGRGGDSSPPLYTGVARLAHSNNGPRYDPVHSFGTISNIPLDFPADPRMMDVVESSARALGLASQRMPSGAGHDAQEIARIAPIGMIFVPSVGGISHSPRELTKPEDVANGVDVLLNAVVEADRRLA